MQRPQVLIFDFGSQTTHLILKQLRDLGVFCTIEFPQTRVLQTLNGETLKGVIFSGGPRSVTPADITFAQQWIKKFPRLPILGICYGMQLLGKIHEHEIRLSQTREFGPQDITVKNPHALFDDVPKDNIEVWMSHGDHVQLNPLAPHNAQVIATSASGILSAVEYRNAMVGVQFHPEVSHTVCGRTILRNFAFRIARAQLDWDSQRIYEDAHEIVDRDVIQPGVASLCAVSGGVDSTVLAQLLEKTCPNQIHFVHVDHGLGRHNESQTVVDGLRAQGIPAKLIQAQEMFVQRLSGVKNPERKRRIIGKAFVEVFETYARQHNLTHLVQGTLYPDVIESRSHVGRSSVIKTHHNVGGIPKNCWLKIVEPLAHLYKDDVRKLGTAMGLPDEMIHRHPFPGPGLAIRILGNVTPERLALLRRCDHILIEFLKDNNLYDTIWQAGCVLLPVQSVGVKGDKRVYQPVVGIRCVVSENAMTAHAARLSVAQLEACATQIMNRVPEVGRVVYDVSPKPPATIEWE